MVKWVSLPASGECRPWETSGILDENLTWGWGLEKGLSQNFFVWKYILVYSEAL